MTGTTIPSPANIGSIPGAHGAPLRTTGAAQHAHEATGDSIAAGSHAKNNLIRNPKPRGKGEFHIGAGIATAGILVWFATAAICLTINYYLQKNAVKNGIRAAARTGAIGNNQNRINASS